MTCNQLDEAYRNCETMKEWKGYVIVNTFFNVRYRAPNNGDDLVVVLMIPMLSDINCYFMEVLI